MSAVMDDVYNEDFTITDISSGFMQNVLKPYRPNCQYLQRASFEEHEDQGLQGFLMKGEFSIGESCYIDDTGHFNAVEYNICFNQIAYLHLGHCIKHGLIPELSAYDQDSFFEKQLSHFLIANLNSSFQSLMNARHFYGTFGIHSIKKTSKCIFMKTYCYFHDDEVGKSKGEVMLAIMHP
jgi:hypothetical protein